MFRALTKPHNILVVLLILVFFWFAMYALHRTGVLPSHSDGVN